MRMKKLFSILAVAATVLLTACDEHQDFPDTAMKVTHILTTDGKVMPYETYEQSCKQAIAVVFNVNQREEMEGNGYAVYLWDIAPEAFADSIGVEQDTSCDLTAYDGNKNTFALYGTTDVKSPLAERVFDMWRYGQSAYIPSVAQMRLLYHAKDIINPYILKCGGTPIPDEDDDWEAVPYRRLPSGSRIRRDPSSRLWISPYTDIEYHPYHHQSTTIKKEKA